MATKSKWNKNRDLDAWERLAVQVALDHLYKEWTTDPAKHEVSGLAISNLLELKNEMNLTSKVTIELFQPET